MTQPSPRFRILPELTAYVACVCLTFACSGATESDPHEDDVTDGPTTDSGPTSSGGNGGDTTTGGGNGGDTTTGGGNGGDTTTGGGNGGAVTTGVVFDCPSIEPARGSGCTVHRQVCDYTNCTAPDYRDAHTLSCEQGAWQLTAEEACEDVPTTCPPSITRGAYCNLAEGSGPCSVVDACGAVRDTYCTNNIWDYGNGEDPATGSGGAGTGPSTVGTMVGTATTSARPDAQCPDVMPTYGAPCCPADYPVYCDYSESGSDAAVGSPSAATGGGPAAVSGTGFGATGGGAPPLLTCAACGPYMTWTSSFVCP